MPNNLVFNNVASELKTQIYGLNGSSVTAVAVNADGSLSIATVTAIVSSGTVIVQGGTLDVVSALSAGTVTVEGGTIDVVGALSAGTVTVEGGTIDVVGALSAGTVTVEGGTIQSIPVFSSSDTTIVVGTSSVDAITIETGTQRTYSFYVANVSGANTITAVLLVSPTNANATYFVADSEAEYAVGPTGISVLVPKLFLRYTKLQLIASDSTTALCYFNAQT